MYPAHWPRADAVVVDGAGSTLPPDLALARFGIDPDVLCVRADGRTLGAPYRFEAIARQADTWTEIWRRVRGTWSPQEVV